MSATTKGATVAKQVAMATTSDHTSPIYEKVTFKQWFHGIIIDGGGNHSQKYTTPPTSAGMSRKRRLPLIDLRSYESFSRRHVYISSVNHSKKDVDKVTGAAIHNDYNVFDDDLEDQQTKCCKTGSDGDDDYGIVINLPFSTLKAGERSCELPPRNVPFAILIPIDANNYHTQRTEEISQSIPNNEDIISSESAILDFFFATTSKATSQSRKPWLVKQIIYESEDIWNEASDLGILYDAKTSVLGKNNDCTIIGRPLPRLWRPDNMVKTILLPLLKDKLTQMLINSNEKSDKEEAIKGSICSDKDLTIRYPQTPFTIIDLGSGAGRDICFLAEELKYFQKAMITSFMANNSDVKLYEKKHELKLRIVGIDNHKGSAKRCLPMWEHRKVSDITRPLFLDLNKTQVFAEELLNMDANLKHYKMQSKGERIHNGGGGIICLYAIRFLNKKLIQQIADCDNIHSIHQDSDEGYESPSQKIALRPGTIFAMSHFCKCNVGDSWDFDHPKESSVLERYELHDKFTQNGRWKILCDKICLDSDHGRTLNYFVAKLN